MSEELTKTVENTLARTNTIFVSDSFVSLWLRWSQCKVVLAPDTKQTEAAAL